MPKNEYWQQKWQENDIRFHKDHVNPLLTKFWQTKQDAHVLVPLCGKTLDMQWLAQQGHFVTGVELSEIACRTFFTEHELEYKEQTHGTFRVFYSPRIQLLCGDIFALTAKDVEAIDSVYDRAALIALSASERTKYAEVIQGLQPKRMMTITLEYEQDAVDGPPFSVDPAAMSELFGDSFVIETLHQAPETVMPTKHPKFTGIDRLHEYVFALSAK